MIEKIIYKNELMAIIVRDDYSKPGVTFFTDNELSQQLAYMEHPAGKIIDPHVHKPVKRDQIQWTCLISNSN